MKHNAAVNNESILNIMHMLFTHQQASHAVKNNYFVQRNFFFDSHQSISDDNQEASLTT